MLRTLFTVVGGGGGGGGGQRCFKMTLSMCLDQCGCKAETYDGTRLKVAMSAAGTHWSRGPRGMTKTRGDDF